MPWRSLRGHSDTGTSLVLAGVRGYGDGNDGNNRDEDGKDAVVPGTVEPRQGRRRNQGDDHGDRRARHQDENVAHEITMEEALEGRLIRYIG